MDVASKRMISWGVKGIPFNVTELENLIRSIFSLTTAKPYVSGDVTPTSEPSKYTLQAVPSKRRISSSAKETPPTVPLLVKEA
jgi:hypothetical protein